MVIGKLVGAAAERALKFNAEDRLALSLIHI